MALLFKLLKAPAGVLPNNPGTPEFLRIFFEWHLGDFETLSDVCFKEFLEGQESDTWRTTADWDVGEVYETLLQCDQDLEVTWTALKRLVLNKERQKKLQEAKSTTETRDTKGTIQTLVAIDEGTTGTDGGTTEKDRGTKRKRNGNDVTKEPAQKRKKRKE